MRRPIINDLPPLWVLVIFFMSFLEAIGLAVYFKADIADAEFASMQPAYTEKLGAPVLPPVRLARDTTKVAPKRAVR
jgi:hypothetical protein